MTQTVTGRILIVIAAFWTLGFAVLIGFAYSNYQEELEYQRSLPDLAPLPSELEECAPFYCSPDQIAKRASRAMAESDRREIKRRVEEARTQFIASVVSWFGIPLIFWLVAHLIRWVAFGARGKTNAT